MVSDTHGYLDGRIAEAVRGCDFVVHAGDVGSGAVLRALHECASQVLAVSGNNDVPSKWPEADRALLGTLPSRVELALPGGLLVAVHGDRVLPAAKRHAKLRALFPDARAIVYGHSHRLCDDREELPWVLNPGAAGKARTFGGPSCMVLEATQGRWAVSQLRFESMP